jgi:formylmethanofuran dehydrogenase subunit D
MKKKCKDIVKFYEKASKKRIDGSTLTVPAIKIANKEFAELGYKKGDLMKVTIEKDRVVLTKIEL